MEPRSHVHINPAVLDRLNLEMAGTGVDLVGELIELFLSDAPDTLAALCGAAKAGALEGIQQRAHDLKGSSVNLGAERLGHLCHEIETAARGQDLDRARALVGEASDEFQIVVQELSRRKAG